MPDAPAGTTRMTFGDWKRRLGPAVPIERIPKMTGRSPQTIAAAVKAGQLPVHTFRAAAVTHRWVRLESLLRYLQQPKASARPKITIEDMARAFRQMVGEDRPPR
ncbi:hypothetical protein [Mucisphaera sp.]|uniref:hypothetical protein n=1 Tax=Mucisphaera sp. TaxID=2913024 RepID=UPI003D09A63F